VPAGLFADNCSTIPPNTLDPESIATRTIPGVLPEAQVGSSECVMSSRTPSAPGTIQDSTFSLSTHDPDRQYEWTHEIPPHHQVQSRAGSQQYDHTCTDALVTAIVPAPPLQDQRDLALLTARNERNGSTWDVTRANVELTKLRDSLTEGSCGRLYNNPQNEELVYTAGSKLSKIQTAHDGYKPDPKSVSTPPASLDVSVLQLNQSLTLFRRR